MCNSLLLLVLSSSFVYFVSAIPALVGYVPVAIAVAAWHNIVNDPADDVSVKVEVENHLCNDLEFKSTYHKYGKSKKVGGYIPFGKVNGLVSVEEDWSIDGVSACSQWKIAGTSYYLNIYFHIHNSVKWDIQRFNFKITSDSSSCSSDYWSLLYNQNYFDAGSYESVSNSDANVKVEGSLGEDDHPVFSVYVRTINKGSNTCSNTAHQISEHDIKGPDNNSYPFGLTEYHSFAVVVIFLMLTIGLLTYNIYNCCCLNQRKNENNKYLFDI
eukprot:406230_1